MVTLAIHNVFMESTNLDLNLLTGGQDCSLRLWAIGDAASDYQCEFNCTPSVQPCVTDLLTCSPSLPSSAAILERKSKLDIVMVQCNEVCDFYFHLCSRWIFNILHGTGIGLVVNILASKFASPALSFLLFLIT